MKQRKTMRRAAALLAGVLLTTALAAAAAPAAQTAAPAWDGSSGMPGRPFPEGTLTVAQDGRFALSLCREVRQGTDGTQTTVHAVQVTDTAAGVTYSTAVSPDYYGSEEKSKPLRDGLSKMFSVSVGDADAKSEVLHSSAADTAFSYEPMPGGARVYVWFPGRSVGLTAEFTVDADGLSVRLPQDGLSEGDKYKILSVDVLPLFAAVRTGEDGYLLFPDGSGAVYEIPQQTTVQKLTTVDVYSASDTSLDTLESDAEQGIRNVMLPAFGIKNGTHAVLGLLTEGAAYAQISLAPGGHLYGDLHRIYPTFRYRRSFRYRTANDTEALSVEKERRAGDVAVRYLFLSDGDADLSGMARACRGYLQKIGTLKKSGAEPPTVSLTFLGGVAAEGTLTRSLTVLSPFSDVAQAVERQISAGRKDLLVTLVGWQKSGYGVYPSHAPAASALGGKSGIADLSALLRQNGGRLLLTDNFLRVNGYGSRPDGSIVYDYLGLPLTDSADEAYLLNITRTQKERESLLRLCEETGAGVLFEDHGTLLYEDYSKKSDLDRIGMAEAVVSSLAEARQRTGLAAAGGGNAYLLGTADLLTDVPLSSSGRVLFSYDVPFWQLVVHGSVAYTPAMPGNMATDLGREKLRWLESGSVPYFLLCTEENVDLRGTVVQGPFSLSVSGWQEEIGRIYDEFAALRPYCGGEIRSWTRLSDTLRLIGYENGCTLTVNYGAEAQQGVPAGGYVLTDGEGAVLCQG